MQRAAFGRAEGSASRASSRGRNESGRKGGEAYREEVHHEQDERARVGADREPVADAKRLGDDFAKDNDEEGRSDDGFGPAAEDRVEEDWERLVDDLCRAARKSEKEERREGLAGGRRSSDCERATMSPPTLGCPHTLGWRLERRLKGRA